MGSVQGGTRPSWLDGAGRWLRALSIRQWLLGAFLLVLLASFPFGGLRAQEPAALPTLAPGATIDAAPVEVAVTKVEYASDLGVPAASEIDGRYIAVFATIRSTDSKKSVPRFDTLTDLLRIEGVTGVGKGMYSTDPEPTSDAIKPDDILVAADAEPMGDLAPGLTYGVVYIWHQTPDQPVPTQVRVAAYSHTWRASSIDDTLGWRDPTRAAVGTFTTKPYVPKKPSA